MDYLVRSGSLSGFLELVQSLGADPIAILEADGVAPAALKDPDTYISYQALARVLNRAAELCGRPDFGALLALQQDLTVVGALGSQLCLQKDVGSGLDLLQRHLDFHGRGCVITSGMEQGHIVLAMDFLFADQVDCTQLTALSLGVLKQSTFQLVEKPPLSYCVELRQKAPPDISVYRELFNVPVFFEQARDCVRGPVEFMAEPIQVAPELRQKLNDSWRRDGLGKLPLNLVIQVEHAIFALLPTGDCNQESVARMLELHPRILQKRLKEGGASYSAILSRVRERLAREQLANSDMPLTELALHLGFSDLTVFSRTFKKWTGFSPRGWREQHGNKTRFQKFPENKPALRAHYEEA